MVNDKKILDPKNFWNQNNFESKKFGFNIWLDIVLNIGLNIGFIIGGQ